MLFYIHPCVAITRNARDKYFSRKINYSPKRVLSAKSSAGDIATMLNFM